MADRTVKSIFIGQMGISEGECDLAVHGLGSCVALLIFDPKAGVGGLSHVLLPGEKPAADTSTDLPAKYAASALESLRSGLFTVGARHSSLRAALVGGARMFESEADQEGGVGTRNVESTKVLLARHGIPLVAQATGGNQGRTVVFELPLCRLRVRTLRDGWTAQELKGL